MSHEPLTFTHTTYNTEVFIYPEEVFAVVYMPTFKSVALLSKGGAAVPVVGDIKEITNRITAAKSAATNAIQGESSNGIPKRKRK